MSKKCAIHNKKMDKIGEVHHSYIFGGKEPAEIYLCVECVKEAMKKMY